MTAMIKESFFVIAVMVGTSVFVCAQGSVVLHTDPPPVAPVRTVIKTSGTATAEYDKYTNTTFAKSKSISLKIGQKGWGYLSAGFTSKGNGVSKPDRIILHVFTAAGDRSFVDKPDATVFADADKIFDGKAEITDARTNGTEIYASFDISIPLSDFEKIVRAEKFGVSVGPSGWFIPKSEVAKFSDLLGLY